MSKRIVLEINSPWRGVLHYALLSGTLMLGVWNWIDDSSQTREYLAYILLAAFILNLIQAGKRVEN